MENCCSKCTNKLCTKNIPIFNILNPDELTEVLGRITRKEYKKSDVIFSEGIKAKTLYFVNEGKIKLYKHTKDGKEQILHILSNGDFFGELNLLKESEYRFNAKAITDCKVCILTNEELKKIMLKNPEISIKVLEIMVERLSKVEELAKHLASNDIDSRIAYLLISLCNEYGEERPCGINIDLPMSREEMANYIGVTRETMSRKLKKFEEEGLIKLVGNKKIIITNKKELNIYI